MTGTGSATSYAEAPASAYFLIPSAPVFDVSGRDATRYLNARLTNDMRLLPVGSHCLAAALSAQGKTQGMFRVLRLEESRYLLVADGGDREAVLAALKKFIVADRVDVRDLTSETELLHTYGNPEALEGLLGAPLPGGNAFAGLGGLWVLRSERLAGLGFDLVGPGEALDGVRRALNEAGSTSLDRDTSEAYRIRYGRPAFPVEINEERLFLEAGPKDAISFSKGCYVGQEVIEKIESHGKLPRRICRVMIDGTPQIEPGAQVTSGAGAIGSLVSRASLGGKTYCFVSIKSDQASSGLAVTVGGINGVIM